MPAPRARYQPVELRYRAHRLVPKFPSQTRRDGKRLPTARCAAKEEAPGAHRPPGVTQHQNHARSKCRVAVIGALAGGRASPAPLCPCCGGVGLHHLGSMQHDKNHPRKAAVRCRHGRTPASRLFQKGVGGTRWKEVGDRSNSHKWPGKKR